MEIIDKELKEQRGKLTEVVKLLQNLSIEISNKELSLLLNDLASRVNEPFMFVVVGEVKAGKSSFINALLNTEVEICKVAPSPMTDTIQLISFGEYREELVSNTLKRIYYPEEILKEIAIVDTPGTNTIIEYHQEITENFIPSSDLVLFVFEAKNPYRQSSWDLLKFVNEEWRKKIVFILQQKDLMSENDLEINIKGLKDHAFSKGIDSPIIFAVSAKDEMENKKELSGFIEVRDYIAHNITGGKAPYLKLENNVNTFLNIYHKVSQGIELRKQQWEIDTQFRVDINKSLESESKNSKNRVTIFIENLLAAYDKTTLEIKNELKSSLSFLSIIKFSFTSIFNKEATLQAKMKALTNKFSVDLQGSIQERIDVGVNDISDSLNQMMQIIDLKIQNSTTILKNDHELFSGIAQNRTGIVLELKESFRTLMNSAKQLGENIMIKKEHKLSENIMKGGGIAIIGMIVTSVTQITIFDITGGLLTGAGLLFAGITTGLKRKQIIQEFGDLVKEGRLKLQNEVELELDEFVERLIIKILELFDNFDSLIEQEEIKLNTLQSKREEIKMELDKIKNFINSN